MWTHPDTEASRPSALTRPAYNMPFIAWPTVAILLVGGALWCFVVYLATLRQISFLVAVPLLSLLSYVLFTPMHEAVHRSAARSPAVNALIGYLASFFLGPTSCFRAYAFLHQEHHRWTNDRHKDPDFWSGVGPRWLLPLSWATTDFYYYYFYMQRAASRPLSEKVEIYATSGLFISIFIAAWLLGFDLEAMLLWFLPARIASAALAFLFNFLPHWPYDVRAEEDPLRATTVITGWETVLSLVFMFHNYHLIHHLFPGIPFYHYDRIWRKRRDELVKLGARVAPVMGNLDPRPSSTEL